MAKLFLFYPPPPLVRVVCKDTETSGRRSPQRPTYTAALVDTSSHPRLNSCLFCQPTTSVFYSRFFVLPACNFVIFLVLIFVSSRVCVLCRKKFSPVCPAVAVWCWRGQGCHIREQVGCRSCTLIIGWTRSLCQVSCGVIIIIILVSVPNGTHDGRIDCEHVCVRVGKRNEKEKKSLVIKVKFKKRRAVLD